MSERRHLEARFPVVIQVPVAWGEMDAMGHVNNVVYFRYFESARLAYFERVGFLEQMRQTGVGPILASTTCRFRAPLTYPDRLWVGASARDLERDRFVMQYRIVSEALGRRAAEGEGVIVAYDYRDNKKAPLPDSVRAKIESLETSVGD